MKIVTVVLLVVHGLISAAQSIGSFNPTGGVPNPSWLDWWPVPLGKSWFLAHFGLERSFFASALGILGLVSGVLIIAAGLGLFGFIVPAQSWRLFVGWGAGLSLLYLAFFAHPFYAVGIGANIATLVILLWIGWPSIDVLGF